MVQSIEQYDDVLKVILKPTKNFPEGSNYFYCDASARWLVEKYNWCLTNRGNTIYVVRHNGTGSVYFHNDFAESIDIFAHCIDHINLVGVDNRDINLNAVNKSLNAKNVQCKGYHYARSRCKFMIQMNIDGKNTNFGRYKNEYEALKIVYTARQQYYANYDYNFLLDRKNDLDILDDELTGKITTEEATFRHVMRYAKDNAWYIYRYGLEEYFNSRGIQIPAFELDSKGYMIDTITKERLCPFK